MNERTKELAEQAGFDKHHAEHDTRIKHFEELVRQDEREQISHTYLKLTLEAVLREREACAKLVEEVGRQTAAAIRQRGEK